MLVTFRNAAIIDGSGTAGFKASVPVEREWTAVVVPAPAEMPVAIPGAKLLEQQGRWSAGPS